MTKGIKIYIAIICCLYVLMCIADLKKENSTLKKQNQCYQTLYNEDIIDNGCDKYFENDEWYIEYKSEVEK